MKNPKDLPLIVSCLQLLALKEIITSPTFKASNQAEFEWLIRCIDKTVNVDGISQEVFGGILDQKEALGKRYG